MVRIQHHEVPDAIITSPVPLILKRVTGTPPLGVDTVISQTLVISRGNITGLSSAVVHEAFATFVPLCLHLN